MIARRTFLKCAAAFVAFSLATPVFAQSKGPIPVVATFSILGDMVKQIGGKHVAVTTLVGPNGDAHVYQPTPADARAVSKAKLLVVNGLGFEGWLHRLIDASDFKGKRVVATQGIEPIAHEDEDHDKHADSDDHDKHADHESHDKHDHGAFDPHAWQSLRNAIFYVDNITAGLAQANPERATMFYRNRANYVEKVRALDKEIRQIISAVPEASRKIVTSHDAFQYFGRDYGLTFLAPQGFSTESEASAKDVARLIKRIRKDKIRAVFVENITDSRLLEQIARETSASIGGTLYPGALSGPDGPAPVYLDMMRHNAMILAQALSS